MSKFLEIRTYKYFILLLIIFMMGFSRGNAQFIQNSSASLFSDVKAFKVGDALMVLIMEDTEAGNGTGVESERSTDLSGQLSLGGAGNFTGKLGLGTGNNFRSSAKNSRTERIRSKISCRVTNVDSNGNLAIEGKRTTQVNGETQTITIKGFVRQVDILPNNSIYSYSILDLTLVIEGNGNLSETNEPGLITKFLRMLF